MLERAKLGILTQGTIFCCARAEDYPGCKVFGLVITARCDVANDKTPIYTYLPIVQLRDWLDRDGGTLLASRIANQASATMRQELKNARHSPSILETEPWDRIINTLFPDAASKTAKNTRARLMGAANSHFAASQCIASPPNAGRARELVQENETFVRSILNELTSHRLTGYYFLSAVDPDGPSTGYVIQLREVNNLPRPIAMSIARGLDLSLTSAETQSAMAHLSAGTEPYAMPVSQVTSPTVEHILQQFSLTFSRIGVADVPHDYVNDVLFHSIFPTNGEGS